MNVEKNIAIHISLDKKTNQVTVEANGVILPDALRLCLTAMESLCKANLSRAKDPALIKALEEDMYEMINLGASTLLSRLFPNIDMRPDITVDALLEAENKLIETKAPVYKKAYKDSAQSEKDVYEHSLAAASLLSQAAPQKKKNKK